ncbi:MAG: exopolysaccharide biosynthesis polyprenyl glycosylphosphotransferase [Chitinivibrionales bacterium]|nr:exopolysaccharide biosynthesis polyprenyl glycosylphosphotransferase [Chitinivibrionales bacterium]
MTHNSRRVLSELFKISDIIAIFACFFISLMSSLYEGDFIHRGRILASEIKLYDVLWIFSLLLLWRFIFALFGLYDSKRLTSLRSEIFDVLKATAICMAAYYFITLLFRRPPSGLKFIGIFWIITSAAMIAMRFILRSILKSIRLQKRNLRHLLIIGTNQRAIGFAAKIEKKPELGYHLQGFVDNEWDGTERCRKAGYEIKCNLEEVFEYIRHHVVDEIFIALPVNSFYKWINRFLVACEEQGIVIHYTPYFFDRQKSRIETDIIDDTEIIRHYTGSMKGLRVYLKRLFDVSASLFFLALSFPLLLLIAIIIKVTSQGPVFFVQRRLGLNKRIFKMYKFRTMVPNAEQIQKELETKNEAKGPVFKIRNDPRITPIGRFLRKTSLDELPQLINVFMGDMSLVGPRPLPVRDYNGFENDRFRRRMSVPPGITCIWQANGRHNIPFDQWMEMDLDYIDNWSLGLDMRIICKTVQSVLQGTGAS